MDIFKYHLKKQVESQLEDLETIKSLTKNGHIDCALIALQNAIKDIERLRP